jgi:uncharacterized protein YcfL
MRRLSCCVALWGVSLAGCADTGVIGAKTDEAATYPNLTLSQPSLSQAVRFHPPQVSRTAAGNLLVVVPLRAASNETLHLEYRAVWFDAQHRPIPPEMTWAPLRLEPRQPQQLSVNSSSSDAVDYNLQFRWGKP